MRLSQAIRKGKELSHRGEIKLKIKENGDILASLIVKGKKPIWKKLPCMIWEDFCSDDWEIIQKLKEKRD